MKVGEYLKARNVGGHEAQNFAVKGAVGRAITSQRVSELAAAFLANELGDLTPEDRDAVLRTANDATSVAIEIAKKAGEHKEIVLENWTSNPTILQIRDAQGVTVAHYLALTSNTTGWGGGLELETYALTTDVVFKYMAPPAKDEKVGHEMLTEKGDTVAHFLARINPKWDTTEVPVRALINTENTTVDYLLSLRKGEATALKALTPNDISVFRAKFKYLQYDPEDVIRNFRWLYLADFENAEIEINRKGNLLIWKSGVWKDGEWLIGTWLNGTWKDGLWKSGNWKAGNWESGTWQDGEWVSGTWKKGKWMEGTWHNGVFEAGVWENGIWKNGQFGVEGRYEEAIWLRGIWTEGNYKGKARQAGLWIGEKWEKEATDYDRVKAGKIKGYSATDLAGRFIKVVGVVDNNDKIKQLEKIVEQYPWLAALDTEYNDAEIDIRKGVRAILWLKGNWKSGKWGADGIWLAKNGKFHGKDALGNVKNVPPLPENADKWKEIPPLTREMVGLEGTRHPYWREERGFLRGGTTWSKDKYLGRDIVDKTPETTATKPEEKLSVQDQLAKQREAAAGKGVSTTFSGPTKG